VIAVQPAFGIASTTSAKRGKPHSSLGHCGNSLYRTMCGRCRNEREEGVKENKQSLRVNRVEGYSSPKALF